MNPRAKKLVTTILRWGIAVFGIWYVLSNMSWYNRILVPGAGGWPFAVRLAPDSADENAKEFHVIDRDGTSRTIPRHKSLAKVDFARVTANHNGSESQFDLLAQQVGWGTDRSKWPYVAVRPRNLWQRYWNIQSGSVEIIKPDEIVGTRPSSLDYPLIDRGIGPMLHDAKPGLLLASLMVIPIIFFITAYRWYLLLKALDILMSFKQAFVVNMVGAFYNTFMPGSTGGDLLKAYYASKLTTHRTRAVMSVIVDRAIGLLALVVVGGVMSGVGFFEIDAHDPARRKCAQIALGSLFIILGTIAGLAVYYTPIIRRLVGLDWIIARLPMQRHVQNAVETMEIYGRRPMLALGALVITLPVHSLVVISATLAGEAFGLPLHPLYYWVVVPVVVLAGSIPISPQGAGVMEFFAILLTKRQGCTVSQAFALTMSIRLVQILWNLTGGLFVLRGGFHAPTDEEKHTMGEDAPENPNDQARMTNEIPMTKSQ